MPYNVTIYWKKKLEEAFIDNKYSRFHTWIFDGGIEIAASSSPHIVPLPMSIESAVDPEEAFIASISSCHMLTFLSMAAERNFIVESYEDHAEGLLGKNSEKKLAMKKITLKPKVTFNNKTVPSREQIVELHHLAHEECFISNSVKTDITILQI
jgi:organic hydroperoxide reductase OsmC/OhrA